MILPLPGRDAMCAMRACHAVVSGSVRLRKNAVTRRIHLYDLRPSPQKALAKLLKPAGRLHSKLFKEPGYRSLPSPLSVGIPYCKAVSFQRAESTWGVPQTAAKWANPWRS